MSQSSGRAADVGDGGSSSSCNQASVFEADRRFKEILLVRHGITEMNEKLAETPWYSRDFVDAGLWDTRLSKRGLEGAQEAHQQLLQHGYKGFDFSRVQTLYASPLTRALQTAELLFAGSGTSLLPATVPKVAQPLLRERLYMSSDVGRSPAELHGTNPTSCHCHNCCHRCCHRCCCYCYCCSRCRCRCRR